MAVDGHPLRREQTSITGGLYKKLKSVLADGEYDALRLDQNGALVVVTTADSVTEDTAIKIVQELKKINLHLSVLSDNHFTNSDVEV